MKGTYWTKGGGATPETAITIMDAESNEAVAYLLRQPDHKEDELADSIKALPILHDAVQLLKRFRAGDPEVLLGQVLEAFDAGATAARW